MPLAHDHVFELSKSLWTEQDFDEMGWHDVHIHALAFDTENFGLLLDIDYLFAWVDPAPGERYYSFWVSPCTLVFSNVHSLTAQIECGFGLEISDVSREDGGCPHNATFIGRDHEWVWRFSCQEGELSFHSVGYRQFTRIRPVRAISQSLTWKERGGICFDRATYDQAGPTEKGEL